MKVKNLKLKIALLSCCFVTASINAISGNIPAMAKTFQNVLLYMIELITTISSLFQMIAILLGTMISKRIGYKNNVLAGILLCGITGIAPIFIENIYFILFTRALFGFGVGLISTALLNLIIYFFEGNERSAMIGMQGSIGGLGSLVTTLIAGSLLVYGWNVSFSTYFIAFIVLVIFSLYVPNVKDVSRSVDESVKEKMSLNPFMKLFGYALLMFISVSAATMFVIKCSTLIITLGYGNAQAGSITIMFISFGSLISGALYGKMITKMNKLSLPFFYLLMALAYGVAALSNSLILTLLCDFIHGFGYMAFVPYIQDIVQREFYSNKEAATSIILVAQSLGAFFTPYLGSILNAIMPSITGLLFLCCLIYLGLLMTGLFLAKKRV